MGEHDLALRISNVVAYLFVFATNLFLFKSCFNGHDDDSDDSSPPDVFASNNTGNATDPHPVTYLTPAVYVQSIWGLIYFLLGGFVIYQWCPSGKDAAVEGIGWYHVIASVLNISYVLVYIYTDIYIANAVLSACLLLTLSKVYHNLEYYPAKNIFDRLFIHWAFVIYTAWMTIETVSNTWMALPILDTVLFSTIAVIVISIIGLQFVDYYQRKDVVFSATIVWGLVALAKADQDVKPILIAASIGSGLIIGGIIRVWVHLIAAWYRLRNQRLGERDPLLRNP